MVGGWPQAVVCDVQGLIQVVLVDVQTGHVVPSVSLILVVIPSVSTEQIGLVLAAEFVLHHVDAAADFSSAIAGIELRCQASYLRSNLHRRLPMQLLNECWLLSHQYFAFILIVISHR